MRSFPLLLLALVLAVPSSGQDVLRTGRSESGTLTKGSVDTWALRAPRDGFVLGFADQISVDVVLTVKDAEGKTVATFDGPARGKEFFQFDSEAGGTYTLEVSPFEDEEGAYTVLLVRSEPIAKDPAKRVDQLVSAYSQPGTPGVAIRVWRDGKTLFSRAYGMANLAYDIPFQEGTPTNIGSTSKQFTAMAVLLLEADGKISLDDDIRTHLPELPDLGHVVTVRNLLTHTSGYREFLNLLLFTGRRLDHGDWIDRRELVDIVQRQPALQNTPGAEFNYNNTAFGLAALLVERVSGMDFPDFMEERIFRPLGMNATQVRRSPEHEIKGRAEGYSPGSGGAWLAIGDLGGAMGAGGIYSTTGDLQKWVQNLQEPRVGTRDMVNRMTTPFVLSTGDTTGYGLGLFIDEHRGLKRIQHGGADVAHRSQLAWYPEINAGITTQSNNASFDGSIAWKVAELFFDGAMEPETDRAEEASDFDPANFEPETFDRYAGQFALDAAPAFVLTFTREGRQYYLQATGQPRFEIFPTSDSTFALQVVEASIAFHSNPDGTVTRLTLNQNGQQPATRVDETPEGVWRPDPDELAEFSGRYFSDEIETFYDLIVEDSVLVVHQRRMDPTKLQPGARDTFAGSPISELSFERSRTGQILGFYVSNGRTRQVRFQRID